MFKLLQGLLRNGSLVTDYIDNGTLDRLLTTVDLPCIPLRYIGHCDAGSALLSLMRPFHEHDHVRLADSITKSLRSSLDVCEDLWKTSASSENWCQLADHPESQSSKELHTKLRGLTIRYSLLSDIITSVSSNHTRIATAYMRSLRINANTSLVADIGRLHCAALKMHVRFKNPPIDTAPSANQSLLTPSAVIGLEDTTAETTDRSGPSATKALATRIHATSTKLLKGKRHH
jgi:hypothetical protein